MGSRIQRETLWADCGRLLLELLPGPAWSQVGPHPGPTVSHEVFLAATPDMSLQEVHAAPLCRCCQCCSNEVGKEQTPPRAHIWLAVPHLCTRKHLSL